MKRFAAVAAFASSLLMTPPGARAEVGHFNGGFVNIRDYFVPAEPGVYGAVYNYFYSSDRLNDRHGDKISSGVVSPGPGAGIPVDVDVDLDLYALGLGLIWVSDWEVLGARYAALVLPSFANASVEASLSIGRRFGGDADNTSFGVGDMFVQPVWLGWSLDHWDFSAAYGFYAATGKYDTETKFLLGNPVVVDSPDNIGYGFWTHQVQGGVAWYPFDNKGTAVTGVLTYENHSEKEDFDLKPGDDISVNWGISQYLPLTKSQQLLLEIGPAGYSTWQVRADTGSDASSNSRDRVHAAGGQLGLSYVPWSLAVNFHSFYEYSTLNRFQGVVLGLSLAKKF